MDRSGRFIFGWGMKIASDWSRLHYIKEHVIARLDRSRAGPTSVKPGNDTGRISLL
jgi:hypothetical protein